MEKETKKQKDSRRRYTQEFKHDVVAEHLSGKTLTELSNKYLIPTSTLGTWTSQLRHEIEVPVNKVEELTQQVKELLEELAERDREIISLKEELEEVCKELPEGVEEALTSHKKDLETIKGLESEVLMLQHTLSMVKEDARKEICTLKDAIIIMAKMNGELH